MRGRAPSGSAACSSSTATSPVSGNATVITCTATRGRKNGTVGVDELELTKMQSRRTEKPRTTRRWWIAGAGIGTLGAAAAGAYLAAPPFWQQFRRDIGR